MFSHDMSHVKGLVVTYMRQGAVIATIWRPPNKDADQPAAHMAKWLRTPIFCALNRLSSHRCGFEPNLEHMRDKPSSACGSQVLLAGSQMFFSRRSPVFAPPYN